MPARKTKRKKESKINLLPREDFLVSTPGRILAWILSSFRIIVIVTELLVMLAFLSRFWFDAQNTDLNELIKEKQAVLASSLAFEKEFRDVQVRLQIFSEYSQDEGLIGSSLEAISESIPPDIFLESVYLADTGLVVQGTSISEISIQQFMVNLDSSETFGEITLEDIRSKEEDQVLVFRMTIQRKEG